MSKSKELLLEALGNVDSNVMTEAMKSQVSEAFDSAVSSELEAQKQSLVESMENKIEDFSKVIVESIVVDQKDKFEKAVEAKSAELTESTIEEAKREIEEAHTKSMIELAESIDMLASETAKTFLEENRVTLVDSVEVQKANSIVESFANFATTFGVDLDSISKDENEELSTLKESLEELESERDELKKEVVAKQIFEIIDESTKDLSELQKEKIVSLVENVEFEDADSYREKIGEYVAIFGKTTPKENKDKIHESKKPSGGYTPSWMK